MSARLVSQGRHRSDDLRFTMRLRFGFAMLLVIVALLVQVVRGGVPNRPLQEDDPNWDCSTMGNRVCGRAVTP
jgi:hypothetical protein